MDQRISTAKMFAKENGPPSHRDQCTSPKHYIFRRLVIGIPVRKLVTNRRALFAYECVTMRIPIRVGPEIDATTRSELERRTSRRIEVSLPVRTTTPASGTIIGVTRDVSLSGAYIYIDDESFRVAGSIEYVMELPAALTLTDAIWVLCFGTLTRIEKTKVKSGIAVKVDAIDVLNSH